MDNKRKRRSELHILIKEAHRRMMISYQIFARQKEKYNNLLKEYKRLDSILAEHDGRLKIINARKNKKEKTIKLSDLNQEQIKELKESLLAEIT